MTREQMDQMVAAARAKAEKNSTIYKLKNMLQHSGSNTSNPAANPTAQASNIVSSNTAQRQPMAQPVSQSATQNMANDRPNSGFQTAQVQTQPQMPQTASPTVADAGVGDQAFSNMTKNMMPLTPEQIKTLRYLFDQTKRAASATPGAPPKPISSSLYVNLSPGATPPVVRMAQGFISTLVFLDATGQPWPIKAIDLGDPQNFNANIAGSTLMVQATSEYKPANLAVMLKGLSTPVMITLMPGQQVIDYRADFHIPKAGPNAQATGSTLPGTEAPELLGVLNGIPPQGAENLQVDGGDASLWSLIGHYYLRTRLTVLSPSWSATMTSADGMHAYEMQETPVILATDHGHTVKLTIRGL